MRNETDRGGPRKEGTWMPMFVLAQTHVHRIWFGEGIKMFNQNETRPDETDSAASSSLSLRRGPIAKINEVKNCLQGSGPP